MVTSTPTIQATTLAFSYVRFSTPQQALGDSLRRQVDATRKYCAEHGLTLDETQRMTDAGLSSYHGKNAAFNEFVRRVKAGEIPQGSVLIVEAFDRMSRQTPREAQEQFLSIINAGVEIVTLIDGQRFSAESVDANYGQLFTSIGMMIGAHSTSKNLANRMRESVAERRGTARIMVPGWIVKTVDGKQIRSVADYPKGTVFGWAVDEAKAKIIRRIYRDLLTKGTDLIAKELNAAGVPLLCTRKRLQRSNAIWNRSTIQKLVRGRQVLGYQAVGHMIKGKREKTGEFIKLYPAVVTEEQWHAAQAAIDGRKSGPGTGRNVTNYSNLFGQLARCSMCGDRLKIAQIGRTRKFKYLACSSSLHRNCTHTRYHRTDKVEANVFALFHGLTWDSDKPDNKAFRIAAQLDTARKEATKAQNGLAKLVMADGDGALIAEMSRQHKAKLSTITKLEHELATTKTATPPDAQLATVQSLGKRLERLAGQELADARGKIAMVLPSLLKALTFAPSGQITATLVTGTQIDLGTVSGHATTNGFQIGPTVLRPGQPVARLAAGQPDIAAFVPYRHPKGHATALAKQSARALQAFKASQRGKGTKKARRAF